MEQRIPKIGFFLIWFLCTPIIELVAQTVVFPNGENGYKSFRIPAIVKLRNGELIAFCEGRIGGAADFGDIDIVSKSSNDNGKTWSALRVVVNHQELQAGNPAPVFDLTDTLFPRGRLFLFYNTGNNHESEVRKGHGWRECWFISSVDGGRNWSEPTNITSQVHKPNNPSVNNLYNFKEDWRSYANTPGHALQFMFGNLKGRIYVAANHSSATPKNDFADYNAHGYYTDDHGKTFHLSENVTLPGSNESTAIELPNDKLMMSVRNQKGDIKCRIIVRSNDGGFHWDTVYFDRNLKDPVCEASMISFMMRQKLVILHCNNDSENKRDRLTLNVSIDEGNTWIRKKLIDADPTGKMEDFTAYSDLAMISKRKVGVLYEKNNYTSIVFRKIRWR